MCWGWWYWVLNFLNWGESGRQLVTHVSVHSHLVNYPSVVAIISNVAIVHRGYLFSRFDALTRTVSGATSISWQRLLLLHHGWQWSWVVSIGVVGQWSSPGWSCSHLLRDQIWNQVGWILIVGKVWHQVSCCWNWDGLWWKCGHIESSRNRNNLKFISTYEKNRIF